MSSKKTLYNIRQLLYKNRRNLNSFITTGSSIILLIILVLCFVFIVSPMKVKHKEQLNTVYEFKEKASKIVELQSISQDMNVLYTDMENIFEDINDIVPDRKNIPYVTSLISLAAEKTDSTITSMSKVLEKDTKVGEYNFKIVRYKVNLISSYENAVNFLATLETTKSIFAIENIVIVPLGEDEVAIYKDPSLIKTELVVDIYMKNS